VTYWTHYAIDGNDVRGELPAGPNDCNVFEANLLYDYLGECHAYFSASPYDRVNWSTDPNAETRGVVRALLEPDANGIWCSAERNPNDSTIWMGQGTVTDDCVGHEYAHAVVGTDTQLDYVANEAGAINESLCDIWGEWIDQANGKHRSGDSVVSGESDAWAIFEDDQCLAVTPYRRMDDPHARGHPELLYEPNYWHFNQADLYEFTHYNNGVGNKLCYLLC